MTPETLEIRLEEWARWVQSGAGKAALGYSPVAAGFGQAIKQEACSAPLIAEDRPAEIEAAVSRLATLGKGIKDGRGLWLRKPRKRFERLDDVLRAEYRAHPMYGDIRYEGKGEIRESVIKSMGMSKETYYRKVRAAKSELLDILDGHTHL